MVTAPSSARLTRVVVLVCGLGLTLLTACSDRTDYVYATVPTRPPTTQSSPGTTSTAPGTASAVTSSTSPGTESSAVTSSTSPTTTSLPTTTVLNPVPTITDPSTTPATTVALPPVTTLVPAVSPGLLRPDQIDPSNPNNSRPVLPEQIPVLEAHLRALQASTFVSATWPINPDAPELLAAPLTPEVLQRVQQAGRERLARGEVLNVEQGVTFRPYVVGAVTDEATVLDCELAGHYWVVAATGELVPPTEVWPAGPGRIVEVGLRQTLVLRDGVWLVSASAVDPSACA